jgi:hypothetical protein
MRRPSLHRPRPSAFRFAAVFCLASCFASIAAPLFRTNDVVAFLGGASVVAADRAGILETTLTLAHPGHHVRFRCLAWEGDTVLSQPRELNFPGLTNLLDRCQATVVCLEFGALEALEPHFDAPAFKAGYRALLSQCFSRVSRVILVIPPPFETKPPPLPNYSLANANLARIADAIHDVAQVSRLNPSGTERIVTLIDLHTAFTRQPPASPWTHDGRDLTASGHHAVAAVWTQAMDSPSLADRAGSAEFWKRPDIAELHQAVRGKNQLWFDSWRPMNWAFLAGDRTDQQASRDHRDRNIRWFPAEMEQFKPLLTEADIRIESLAAQIRLVP